MTTAAHERSRASELADTTCPRCGSPRQVDQAYCLDCGLALPPVSGRLPGLRRRWVRRIGWYPGDWVWTSLLTLVVAAAGAAGAIVLTEHRDGSQPRVITALGNVPVAEPTVAATGTGQTATLPTAPEPSQTVAKRITWPAGQNGWTIVLVSYPKTTGRATALQTAAQAVKAGLVQVGVLDSSGFASLQPGYYVVFSGVYSSQAEANTAAPTVHQAGFGAAYARPISR